MGIQRILDGGMEVCRGQRAESIGGVVMFKGGGESEANYCYFETAMLYFGKDEQTLS